MKVLALNSSPRAKGQSKTELMMLQLVKGMAEAGAFVEVVNLREKRIRNCTGCFTCWTRTPGVCIHKDDMTSELFPKWLSSDVVIYATPLYHYTLNASLKAFIERTLPLLQPFFRQFEGKTFHPLRSKHPKVVFLSAAGFPEQNIFDPLSAWVQYIFGKNGNLLAEIYRPMAEAMQLAMTREQSADVLEAVCQAGREIVDHSSILPETLKRIQQPLMENNQDFFDIGNLMWKTCIAEGLTPETFNKKGLVLRPDTIETFSIIMKMGFNASAATDTRAVIEFRFSQEREGVCHFTITDGRITAALGYAEKADLIIESPFGLWLDIMSGKKDGQQSFLDNQYRVQGDFSLLMRLSQLFGKKQ
jgi:multimeric flavodoxin WrbA/putative sterol carrier protein